MGLQGRREGQRRGCLRRGHCMPGRLPVRSFDGGQYAMTVMIITMLVVVMTATRVMVMMSIVVMLMRIV